MRFSLIAVLSLVAALAAPIGAAHAGSALSGGELKALFPGKFEAVWKDKTRLTLDASSGGKLVGSVGIISGNGSWSVKGNQLCIYFNRWKGEDMRCGPVVQSGGWYLSLFRNEDGKPRLRFRPL